MDPGGPIYRRIEFCRNEETLWGKLKSGRYDWLGVHPDGKFVLGSPPLKRSWAIASPTVVVDGATSGVHGVSTETVVSPKPSARWYNTEAEARAWFDEQVKRLQDAQNGPGIVRVRLVVDGETVAEEFIVRRISTYQ